MAVVADLELRNVGALIAKGVVATVAEVPLLGAIRAAATTAYSAAIAGAASAVVVCARRALGKRADRAAFLALVHIKARGGETLI